MSFWLLLLVLERSLRRRLLRGDSARCGRIWVEGGGCFEGDSDFAGVVWGRLADVRFDNDLPAGLMRGGGVTGYLVVFEVSFCELRGLDPPCALELFNWRLPRSAFCCLCRRRFCWRAFEIIGMGFILGRILIG